jgi:Fe-S-cluster-containing hydrogenase component 2
MSFANKVLPMEDTQCVRCSACVQGSPIGTLSFGRLGSDRLPILDSLAASSIQLAERGSP